jgi:hypothetical protein
MGKTDLIIVEEDILVEIVMRVVIAAVSESLVAFVGEQNCIY